MANSVQYVQIWQDLDPGEVAYCPPPKEEDLGIGFMEPTLAQQTQISVL